MYYKNIPRASFGALGVIISHERKNIMKKFTILVALILCVTIGGVYATWNYASADVTASDMNMSINLATATTDNPKGQIINVLNSMNVKIDDTNHDYYAEPIIEGAMGFVFTPSAGVDSSITNNGISMTITLTQSNPVQYEDDSGNLKDVFEITNATIKTDFGTKIDNGNATTLCPGVDLTQYINSFFIDIVPGDLIDKLTIGSHVYLPTKADYDTLHTAIQNSGKLTITVTEQAVAP